MQRALHISIIFIFVTFHFGTHLDQTHCFYFLKQGVHFPFNTPCIWRSQLVRISSTQIYLPRPNTNFPLSTHVVYVNLWKVRNTQNITSYLYLFTYLLSIYLFTHLHIYIPTYRPTYVYNYLHMRTYLQPLLIIA